MWSWSSPPPPTDQFLSSFDIETRVSVVLKSGSVWEEVKNADESVAEKEEWKWMSEHMQKWAFSFSLHVQQMFTWV